MGRAAALKVALLAAVLLLSSVGSARADGDPASDILVIRNVYFPYPRPSADAQAALQAQVDAVWAGGGRVKVAVIATPTDLGAIPSLFGHPAQYAQYLGQELRLFYPGPLLIVMSAGFAFYENGAPTGAADAVLARAKLDGSSLDSLTRSAAGAVAALGSAHLLGFKDTRPPEIAPRTATVRPGAKVKLGYQVYDDSGKAAVLVEVKRPSGRVVATFHVPLKPVVAYAVYTVTWRVPATLAPAALSLCVQATDAAGNSSPLACAKLKPT